MERFNTTVNNTVKAIIVFLFFISHIVTADTLNVDTTISVGDYSYSEDLVVPSGVTLTIEAGAILRFNLGNKIQVQEGGRLFVSGTESSPVTFTSDTRLPASWAGLVFEGARADGLEIVIDYAIVEYADKALYTNQPSVKATVTNSTVRDNNYGVYIDAYYQSAPNHPTITFNNGALYNNTQFNYFTDLFYGEEITVIDATGNWWGSNDPQVIAASINDLIDGGFKPSVDFSGYRESEFGTAIGTSFSSYIKGNVTWSATDGVLAQSVRVGSGSTLTITAGTQIDAKAGAELIVDDGGKLFIQGTNTAPVIFTSVLAVPDSWGGLRFEGSRATANDIVLDNVIIEFADKALYTNQPGVKVTVTNSTVRYNNYGVYIDAYYQSAPNHPTITFNNGALYNNTQFNYFTHLFYGDEITVIDATGNWWGSNDPQVIATSINDLLDGGFKPSVDFSGFKGSEFGSAVGTSYAGYIKGEVIWSATDGVLAQPVHVGKNSTLTITAGASVRAHAGSALIVDDGGRLFVQGSQNLPVTFSGLTKVPGSWQGLSFEGARIDESEIVIDHAIIEYADKALFSNKPTVKALVTHSTLRHNNFGVYLDANYQSAPNHPLITFKDGALYNNTHYNYFTNLFYGDTITINATGNWWGTADLTQLKNSIWDLNDGAFKPVINFGGVLTSENGGSLAGTHLMGEISGEHRWQYTDGVVLDDISIKSGAKIIVEAGTHLEFLDGAKLIVEEGAQLSIIGEADNLVTFTSGNLSKVAGDWGGIEVRGNTNVHISKALIEYADKAISFNGIKASGTVTDSIIENNNTGVYVNAEWQSLDNHPTPIVTNSVIQNNANYHYFSEQFNDPANRTLNAKGNYWGTSDATAIAQNIYDHADSGNSPIVDYGYARENEISTLTANAGDDIITFSTLANILNGEASSDSVITEKSWQQYLGDEISLTEQTHEVLVFTPGPGGRFSSTSTTIVVSSFIAPDVEKEQLYSFIYTVTDENQIKASDKLNVIVKPLSEYNQAPTVAQPQEVLVAGSEEVSVTLTASDSDNDPLTYTWQQVSGDSITLTTNNTNTLAFTAPSNSKNKIYSFKLTVTDNHYTVERTVVVAVKAMADTAGTYYYHNDHLGTPQVMTDNSANIVWRADYTPFGQANLAVETITNNIRFSGQYYDQESDLHYNYFRDYDPELGRYIQSDPIGLAGGINTYGYAYQNPVMNYDPFGLDVWGLNIGFGGTYKLKGSYSYQLMLDSQGNLAIQKTTEYGMGDGTRPTAGGFLTLVYGTPDGVGDLLGPGASFSGSGGGFAAAFNTPWSYIEGGDNCANPSSYWDVPGATFEFGFSRGLPGAEAGATFTNTEHIAGTAILGDIGRWLGSTAYWLVH